MRNSVYAIKDKLSILLYKNIYCLNHFLLHFSWLILLQRKESYKVNLNADTESHISWQCNRYWLKYNQNIKKITQIGFSLLPSPEIEENVNCDVILRLHCKLFTSYSVIACIRDKARKYTWMREWLQLTIPSRCKCSH